MMAGVAMQHHACRAYSLLHARPQRINKTRQDKESKKGRLVNRSGPPWGGHVRLAIVTRKGNQASKQAKSGVMGGWSLEVEMAVAESSTFESSALKKVPPIHFLPSLFSVPIYPPRTPYALSTCACAWDKSSTRARFRSPCPDASPSPSPSQIGMGSRRAVRCCRHPRS